MSTDGRQEVVGREAELSVLASFLDDTRDGPAALLLEGEAGVGKTTLWREALAAARSRSYRVLSCQPVESEAKLSFAALGDLLSDVVDEVAPALPGPQTRALDVALLRAEPEGAVPDNRAVSVAVLEVFRAASRAAPLVVAVDDVQWLDPPTARVLEFALRRLVAEPVGLLATLRSGGEVGVPFGLDRFLPEGRFRRLDMGPLTVDALGRLLRARVGAEFLLPTLVRLHDMSGGNPFFALEIARASLRGDKPATGQLLPVPQSLRELVRRRVSALPADAREALLVAAALASPTVDQVREASGDADGQAAADALAKGVEAGVIEIDGRQIRFTHPLFGSVIFSDASSEERRALHRRLAETSADTEERARHLALAVDGPDPEVAAALDDAALRARARGAPDAAAELSEMAVRLTPVDRPDDARDRRVRAALFHLHAGNTTRALALSEEAVDASPPGPTRAEAIRLMARITAEAESWSDAAVLLESALGEAGDDPALLASIEQGIGYAGLFTGDLAGAEVHAARALELAEQVGDAAPVAEALQFVAYMDFALGRGMGTELLDRAVELERQTEDYWDRNVRPTFTQSQLHKYTDRFDAARSGFTAQLERAAEHGHEHSVPALLYHLAELECWAGDWDAAERHAQGSLAAARQTGMTVLRTMGLYAVALVDAHRGRAEPARTAAGEGLALAESVDLITTQIQNLSVLGFLDLFEGNPTGAHGHLGRTVALLEEMGVEEPALFRVVPDDVEALVAMGRLDEARALLGTFEDRARRLDRAWALATAGRCRGLVLAASGDVPRALEALAAALREHERVPEPFALARTLFVQARIQRRAKLKAEARRSFEQALAIYEGLGASVWAERAGREARRVGVRAPGPIELTPTEERVAALVAQGQTNQQVADALFMSVNTVEWNLGKIYRKLGVRSRTELAARLQQRGGSG